MSSPRHKKRSKRRISEASLVAILAAAMGVLGQILASLISRL